jgi:ribose/xylose/arabinose/galactoside ABC-type transport system permease subunit
MSTLPQTAHVTVKARVARNFGQEFIVLAALVLLFAGAGIITPRFWGVPNLSTIFAGNAYIAVAAIGMSMIIIAGHIDVSIGALIGVLSVVAGSLAVANYPVWICWTVPVVLGIVVESLIGVLVAYARIPSIVVTLGMMSILKGSLISISGGTWISNMPESFMLSQFHVFGIRAPFWIMIVCTAVAAWWMRHTARGRSIYAIGGNSEAARTAGIPVQRQTVFTFGVHGLFAGIAALMYATQLQVIQATTPTNLELTIITASVIGGVSILGGTGTVIGSTLAAILFATINSALIFTGVSAFWLQAVLGTMILVTVLADMARRHRIK